MFGDTELYTLLNVTGVTSLLGNDINGVPALFNDNLIPQDCPAKSTVNFYLSSPYDPSLPYGLYRYSINCRAATYTEACTIAYAVVSAVHRVSGDDYFASCTILPVIAPVDDRDTYNCVVELTLKTR